MTEKCDFSSTFKWAIDVSIYIYNNKFITRCFVVFQIQFTIIILHTTQMFMPSCKMAPGIAVAFVPNVIINFYFFIKFYKQAYGKSKRKVL